MGHNLILIPNMELDYSKKLKDFNVRIKINLSFY